MRYLIILLFALSLPAAEVIDDKKPVTLYDTQIGLTVMPATPDECWKAANQLEVELKQLNTDPLNPKGLLTNGKDGLGTSKAFVSGTPEFKQREALSTQISRRIMGLQQRAGILQGMIDKEAAMHPKKPADPVAQDK